MENNTTPLSEQVLDVVKEMNRKSFGMGMRYQQTKLKLVVKLLAEKGGFDPESIEIITRHLALSEEITDADIPDIF